MHQTAPKLFYFPQTFLEGHTPRPPLAGLRTCCARTRASGPHLSGLELPSRTWNFFHLQVLWSCNFFNWISNTDRHCSMNEIFHSFPHEFWPVWFPFQIALGLSSVIYCIQFGEYFFLSIIDISNPSNKVGGGYTGFTLSVCPSICPSVCGQNRVCFVSSTILAGSISYLHILSTNFRSILCVEFLPNCFTSWLSTSWSGLLWMSDHIAGMAGPIDLEQKGTWIDMILDPLYDIDIWPHQWPSPWIFKVKFGNSFS